MIKSSARGIFRKADRCGGVGLRIAVDEKRWLVSGGKAGSEVYSGSGLSDPTFLICHRNDSCQNAPKLAYVAKI